MKRSPITNSIINQLIEEQNNKCNYCGCSLTSNEFHMDHVIALKDGGEDKFNNLQILCINCHAEKTGSGGIIKKRDFLKSCDRCGKVIRGINEKQVDGLIRSHQLGKKCKKNRLNKVKKNGL